MTAETLEQKILIACSGSLGTAICHVQPPDLVRGKKAVFLDSLQNGVVSGSELILYLNELRPCELRALFLFACFCYNT